MPSLNWDAFAQLPGSPEANFENLCRAVIRRHYEQFGTFAALAAQPGVEFHLKLTSACSLGPPGRWYGWQCRWYDLPSGRAIGSTRRDKIKKAISTTQKELPGVTDWVLWTRHPLTRGDQAWIHKLKTQMRLHLWTADEVEEHLSGEAEIFRRTYFSDLVLLPAALAQEHERSVAPIRWRWLPEAHQPVDAERTLRRQLGEVDPWDELRKLADQLGTDVGALGADRIDPAGSLADAVAEIGTLAQDVSAILRTTYFALAQGDLELLRQLLAAPRAVPESRLAILPRQLRSRRQRSALSVTNILAHIRRARKLLDELNACIGVRLISVLAEAGRGKTELAAQLTAPAKDRPAGILIHGINLNAGQSLDDLARRVVIQATPTPSMEALVAAVDAAGQRAHRRLPIVIDGLNEAEDARDWQRLLASLDTVLRRYPYVLVVCTVRGAFANEALPPGAAQLEIPGFEHDTAEAIRRYFDHYRIDATDAELPWELLSEPLLLRLFCEVTNPTRERNIAVERGPRSLTTLFERYLVQAAERCAALAPRSHRFYQQNILAALDAIGAALWNEKARSLDEAVLRHQLQDEVRLWDESIVRALQHEGVLLRFPGNRPGAPRTAGVNDALAGHLVASALLAKFGHQELAAWLNDPATVAAFAGPLQDQHPLAADIVRALVGLVPQLHRQQLWPLVEEPMRTTALLISADLDGASLDTQTVESLAQLIIQPLPHSRDLFDRLWQTRGAPNHPLSAEFLDTILKPMGVAERDIRWTEWVRRNGEKLLDDLQRLETRWRQLEVRTIAERLRALWVLWTLTSTVRELRDQATRTLYWFGRGNPAALFDLTLTSLNINDQYVPERLLAASCGVALAHQLPDPKFSVVLKAFLTGLRDALTGPNATHPTNHWLARLYVQGIVLLAHKYHPDALPEDLEGEGRVAFAPGLTIEPIVSSDSRAVEVDRTLQMDFENYTLGRLVANRQNYDMEHPGHQAAVAYVRGTVWTLGWREIGLGAMDADIISYDSRGRRAPTERYGKKYGWIAYYQYAGMLEDQGHPARGGERLPDVQIDPSFPEQPSPAPFQLAMWARPTPKDNRRWLRGGVISLPDELLYRSDIDAHSGPWIAVKAFLEADEQTPGRRVFGFISALLVADAKAEQLIEALIRPDQRGGVMHPEEPTDHYTFAGEIPWSPEFARSDEEDQAGRQYRSGLYVDTGLTIDVETFAHRYGWESYHSVLNDAGDALVPSLSFSRMFDLRGTPQSFNQTLPDGTMVAISLSAPSGFKGDLLYLREDLVHRYANGRRLVWYSWGERNLYPYMDPAPDWLAKARRSYADVWRYVCRGEKLSRIFARKSRRQTSRLAMVRTTKTE